MPGNQEETLRKGTKSPFSRKSKICSATTRFLPASISSTSNVLVRSDGGVFQDFGQLAEKDNFGVLRPAAEIGLFRIHPRDDLKKLQNLIDSFLKFLDAIFKGKVTEFRHNKVLWIAVSTTYIGRGAMHGCMELIKPFMKTSEHLHELVGIPLRGIHVLEPSLQSDLRRVSTDLRSVSTDLRSIGTDLRSISTDLRSVGTRLRSTRTHLRSTCTRLRSTCTRLRSVYTDLRSVYTRLRSVCTRLRSTCTRLRSVYTDLRSVYTRLRSVCTDLRSIYTR